MRIVSPANLIHRIGRRGATLLLFAMIDILYGYSLLAPTERSLASPVIQFLTQVMPLWAWGCMSLIVGIICLIHAFRFRDGFGFAAAIFLKLVWSITLLLAWIFIDLERAWVSVVIWGGFAGWLALVVGWPDDLKARHE